MVSAQPLPAPAHHGPALSPELRPNLLGIGAAKSGTTWFADLLGRHPNIWLPPQKELNALYYNDLAERLNEYKSHFVGSEQYAVRCDFSVRYLSAPNAPAAAAHHAPDALILAVLRHPVDQVQSHYWHQRRQNFAQPKPVEPAPDLFAALERFPDLLLEPALYGKHLARWSAHFPCKQFMLIDYDELTREPMAVMAQLCARLGLALPDPISTHVASVPSASGRQGVAPRGGTLGRLYPKLYTAVARGPYQWAKQRFGVTRMDGLKRRLRLREIAEAVFFKKGYPKLDPDDRARLLGYFADDLALLESAGFAPATSWRTEP